MHFNTFLLRMLCLVFKFVLSPDVRFIEIRFKILPLSFATYFKFEFNLKL